MNARVFFVMRIFEQFEIKLCACFDNFERKEKNKSENSIKRQRPMKNTPKLRMKMTKNEDCEACERQNNETARKMVHMQFFFKM